MKTGKAHIGTSGWSYQHWKEIFYPPKLKSAEWFSFYAKHFDCSEINTSFYHLPKEATVQKWTDISPRNFRFCPKLSRFITHMKKLRDAEEPLKIFFERFAPMQKKMGPVLIQLPPMLGFKEDVVRTFFEILVTQYPKNEFVLEVRHESWLKDEVFALLEKYGIGFVISQSDQVFPYAEVVTSKQVYIRFHGPGDLYASEYTTRMLNAYGRKCRAWMEEGRSVWCFFNNDIHGYAFNDARRLKTILAKPAKPAQRSSSSSSSSSSTKSSSTSSSSSRSTSISSATSISSSSSSTSRSSSSASSSSRSSASFGWKKSGKKTV